MAQTMDLQTLRARCRLQLVYEDQWPDATINAWIKDAIDAYSLEFPRACTQTITLTTGAQSYALAPDVQQVLRVEYPTGQTPRQWLQPVDLASARFANQEAVYAIMGIDIDTTLTAAVGPLEIHFAPTVLTTETARIYYSGHHVTPATDAGLTSVPAAHAEALIAFVEFRSHQQLEQSSIYNTDGTTLTASELGMNTRKAWNRYKEITDRLQAKTPAPAGVIIWRRTP